MNLLQEAKKRFEKGDLFLTATGNIKSPITISELKVSTVHLDTITNEGGGIICMPHEETGAIVWATLVPKNEK